uniref:Uncharacterized protein n=1 Tax=mine drainage metagenome TaxID=410659 RepID=E6Q984_9ZZZZ
MPGCCIGLAERGVTLANQFLVKRVVEFLGKFENLAEYGRIRVIGLAAQAQVGKSVKAARAIHGVIDAFALVALIEGGQHLRGQRIVKPALLRGTQRRIRRHIRQEGVSQMAVEEFYELLIGHTGLRDERVRLTPSKDK